MKYINGLCIGVSLTIWLLSSCESKEVKDGAKKVQSGKNLTEIFEFPITRFGLPYDMPLSCDSNSLIYLRQIPFDTSYLLHFVKRGEKIQGVCYIVPPSSHRDLGDFHDEEHQLLFFDGLSFTIGTKQWEEVKKYSNRLISSLPDSIKDSSPCFDCHSFTILFNSNKRTARNNDQQRIFREYDSFIRDNFLYPFFTKRKR
ncbi:MAG: hypothetical protein IPP99_04100 [Chitinophagaceae bacterium]|nr:hypothetical protein [Chitinophagaceae bacterium]